MDGKSVTSVENRDYCDEGSSTSSDPIRFPRCPKGPGGGSCGMDPILTVGPRFNKDMLSSEHLANRARFTPGAPSST